MKNIIISSIIGFALGSTVTVFVIKGLPQGINAVYEFPTDLSSTIKNSTWATEDGILTIYFTDTDVCVFDVSEVKENFNFSYSVSDNKIFLTPEDIGSTMVTIGSTKFSWTFEYQDGYLITDFKDGQLILKKIK